MAEIYSDNFPMDETLCKDCAFRMSRIISPVDPEDFMSEEELEELGVQEGEPLYIERHTCLIDHSDMDYIVKDCSHYKNMTEQAFFINNPYE